MLSFQDGSKCFDFVIESLVFNKMERASEFGSIDLFDDLL